MSLNGGDVCVKINGRILLLCFKEEICIFLVRVFEVVTAFVQGILKLLTLTVSLKLDPWMGEASKHLFKL